MPSKGMLKQLITLFAKNVRMQCVHLCIIRQQIWHCRLVNLIWFNVVILDGTQIGCKRIGDFHSGNLIKYIAIFGKH
ncbi:hypothetical protein O9K51_11375 [Purpureocillium lavendulum]|uniref:Uncharacterized protein n=1 Tax=Purpureocillium lavendulum TaxID=1247861 RepID=A0AB34FBN0_9HYPO|nr:hypothetical protein O9K51_11375 [Purpureocillium lavendulum]